MQIRITKKRAALAALFVLAGIGLGSLLSPLVGSALATVGQTVNISDHSANAYFAKVDSGGALKTTAAVTGRVGMAAPASPWSATVDLEQFPVMPGVAIAGPSTAPIDITSVSISSFAPNGSGPEVRLLALHVPSSATTCSGALFDKFLWRMADAGGLSTPLGVSFPTPLQWKAPTNTKACLFAYAGTGATTYLNASGFYG